MLFNFEPLLSFPPSLPYRECAITGQLGDGALSKAISYFGSLLFF